MGINRRAFVRNVGCAALGTSTFVNTLLNLKAVNASAGFNSSVAAGGDYKALVCVLLAGGTDSFNMLAPITTDEYNEYATTRSNLAVPNYDPADPNNEDNLKQLTPIGGGTPTHGVHPSMGNIQGLFNSGKLAFVSNIGTMIEPVEKPNLYSGAYDLPLGLFSHIDQVSHWQTGIPQDRVNNGWGGRMSELLIEANQNQGISMNMSFAGSNLFQTGESSVEYALIPGEGSLGIQAFDDQPWNLEREMIRNSAVNSIVDETYQDIFKKTYINTVKTARDGHVLFSNAFEQSTDFTGVFAEDDLSRAFETIAKTISVQSDLNMNRQIFFVELGGWDHHDGLGEDYAYRLGMLDDALGAFNTALEQINMSDCVTTFSISEFGRTLTSNGNGSDHAWGGNMMVMGGAVNGGQIYGSYPSLVLDGDLEIGGGVLIPTLSADEYFAEISKWFGVMDSDLTSLFPNLGNFYDPMSGTAPIGFLQL